MNIPPQNTDPNPQAGNGTDPQPQAGNPNGQAPNGTPTETPNDDIARQIAELRAENAKYRKKAQEQAAAAQAAEEARLKEQGEYKALAEKHEAKVQELEPTVEKYTKLSELLSAQIKADIKDWPKEIKIFDPGDDAPVEDRLAWMEKSKPLIEKLTTAARQPGNGPNPKPSNDPTADDLKTQAANKLRATGKYNA